MAEATTEKKENWFVRAGKRIAKWFREMKAEFKESYGQLLSRLPKTLLSYWRWSL